MGRVTPPAPLIWKFSILISIRKIHPLTLSLPTAQSPKRTFCNKLKIKKWPSQYHRSKNDYHEKHWASFIPYTEHPLSQILEYSAWRGMVETELRSTDEIHSGRMLMSHRQPRDHMVKYLQGICALRPVSFISGNFHLCRVGLRKFQILYRFTFGDLDQDDSAYPESQVSMPASTLLKPWTDSMETCWKTGSIPGDSEATVEKRLVKAYFLIFPMLRNLRLSAQRHPTVVPVIQHSPHGPARSLLHLCL